MVLQETKICPQNFFKLFKKEEEIARGEDQKEDQEIERDIRDGDRHGGEREADEEFLLRALGEGDQKIKEPDGGDNRLDDMNIVDEIDAKGRE